MTSFFAERGELGREEVSSSNSDDWKVLLPGRLDQSLEVELLKDWYAIPAASWLSLLLSFFAELKTDPIEVFGEFPQALFAGRLGDSGTNSLGSLNKDDSYVLFCRGEYAFGSGPRNTVDSNVLFFRGVVARIPAGRNII